MKNDLISREALKKAINENRWVNKYDFEKTVKLIDNAPTVEPFEPDYVGAERLKARQRGYEQGYHFGMEIGKTLNPKIKQGKWIWLGDNPNHKWSCNKCGRGVKEQENYCPNCGADMRGDQE